jgi:hypothetical protein
MEPNNPTAEDVWAMIYETQRRQQETDRIVKNLAESHEKTEKVVTDLAEKQANDRAETNRFLKESKAETDRQLAKLSKSIRNMNKEVGGIGRGNGGFAEEYFFNSLKNNMDLFGEKFDSIKKNVPAGADESDLDGEFDIVYYNCKSVAIVEVKYRAQLFHVFETVDKVETFRNNYPVYAGHKIYLALAAMFFDREVETECADEGIAVIKQVGGDVVINDKHIKAF